MSNDNDVKEENLTATSAAENTMPSQENAVPESDDGTVEVETTLKSGDPANVDESEGNVLTHMNAQELLYRSFQELMSLYTSQVYTTEESERNQYIIAKFNKFFGKDFSTETEFDMDDPRVLEVANDYLHDKLEIIKDNALSMDINKLNKAINEICRFVGFDLDLSTTPKDSMDAMFKHRVGDFPEMASTYAVLDTARDVLDISTDSTMSLGSEIRLEKDIKLMEKLRQDGFINGEQLAIMYESVARIHDHYFAKDKNNTEGIKQEKQIAVKYMEKALSYTANVDRIQACAYFLKKDGKYTPKVARMIQQAYERFFADEQPKDKGSLSVAHEKYADLIIGQENMVGFLSDTQRREIHNQTDTAVNHYIQAIEISPTPENKTYVLNKLVHNLHKFNYYESDEAFWKSINVVNDMFSGKNKVMNLVKLLPQVRENQKFKKILLEATINELIDAKDVDEASRKLLLKNTGKQWLELADVKADAAGIDFVTNKLKELDKTEEKRMKQELKPIVRLSSSGNDYFSK